MGGTIPAIAEALGRHRSTVWRELGRNHAYRHGPKNPRGAQLPRNRKSHYAWGYLARWAQGSADRRARRPRPVKLGHGQPLRPIVLDWLRQRWSPEQIARRLAASLASLGDVRPRYPLRVLLCRSRIGPFRFGSSRSAIRPTLVAPARMGPRSAYSLSKVSIRDLCA